MTSLLFFLNESPRCSSLKSSNLVYIFKCFFNNFLIRNTIYFSISNCTEKSLCFSCPLCLKESIYIYR